MNKSMCIQGQRVRLHPLEQEHVSALFKAAQYSEIWEFTTNKIHTIEDMQDYVNHALSKHQQGDEYPFIIFDMELNQIVGCTRYYNASASNRSLDIGYTWYTPSVWRTRVNTETKYLLLKHAFEELGCIRVGFHTDERNTRSQKAIERLGAVKEGIIRNERILPDGYIRNAVTYSIIDGEWADVKHRLETYLNS